MSSHSALYRGRGPPFWSITLLVVRGQGLDCLPLLVSPTPRHWEDTDQIPRWDFGRPPCPVPLQEAVDDIFSALKHDPQTAIPEICSLKPQAQALITQGLALHCRALLSQLPDSGAALSDGDIRGLLAAGEALIRIDARQPSWHLLLADVLTAAGTRGNVVCARPLSPPAASSVQTREIGPGFGVFQSPSPRPESQLLGPGPHVGLA